MAEAICLRCGNRKKAPWERCKRCGYDPTANDEESLVKSVYLSVGRFADLTDKERYRKELDQIAGDIERGDHPVFIESELVRLRAQRITTERIPSSAAWGAVLRLFLPAVGLLLLLFGIAYVIRRIRG